jgi:hypothetical protein
MFQKSGVVASRLLGTWLLIDQLGTMESIAREDVDSRMRDLLGTTPSWLKLQPHSYFSR